MKQSFILIAILCLHAVVHCQENHPQDKILYGKCSVSDLKQPPYDSWWNKGYDDYIPNAEIMTTLRKLDLKDITIEIFFGSWCGDSKRELPHFDKVISDMSFPQKQLSIIALGGSDSLYKQSPQREETGKGIFRVPVFIIYKKGKELGRINEFPVLSLERDLLAILSGNEYQPNYNSFSIIKKWLNDGVLADKNVSERGLANSIRARVENEYVLNSLAKLLVKQHKKEEAIRVFKINYWLFPESAIGITDMGSALAAGGDNVTGTRYVKYALSVNKKPQDQEEILSALYQIKEQNKEEVSTK